MFIKILLLFILLFSNVCFARPVSYPEGWTFMTKNDSEMNSAHLHYSPTFNKSLGYKIEYSKSKKYTVHSVHYNHLIKRWNKKHSQANFYTKTGIGILHTDFDNYESKLKYAGYFGVSADWETRRYFTSYENKIFSAGKIDSYFSQKVKIGIAPYIGNYGDIHTWLMFEVSHNPKNKDSISYSPIVRFFYETHLMEIGMNNNKKLSFNYVKRF
jgi:hypothetical protein